MGLVEMLLPSPALAADFEKEGGPEKVGLTFLFSKAFFCFVLFHSLLLFLFCFC